MPAKTIYIQKGTPLDEFLIMLEKRDLTFSEWANDKVVQEVKAENLRSQPVKTMWRCYHPKIKLAQKTCSLEVCPMQDWSLGPVAKERVFAAAQPKCLFRIKP